ncbi:MAG TPA: alpha/beta hydrolase [Bacteroidales bacterium]|nr:alpha/beta hydrolase [Bacteroidales bacterium]
MRIIFLFSVVVVFLTSCLKMDDFLYNPNEHPIDSYRLQNYTGEVEFRLPDSMALADSMIHLFTMMSNDQGDVKKIYGLYLGDISKIATDTVILYCHGNKDHLDFYYPRAQLLAWVGGKHHYGVMTFDYRGFGLSEGKPSESGLYADADAAMQWLKQKGLTSDRLMIYGFSMGTAPATELSAKPRSLTPSKIILEAPFASAEVFYQDATGIALPGSYVMELKIDNAEEIKSVNQPFLWFHGINDDFISMKTHGEVVFKNYRGVKKYGVRTPGANHSDIPVLLTYDKYRDIIHHFVVGDLQYDDLVKAQ